MSHDIVLAGCKRAPLADYLKGLGVFRLVAEQFDRDTRAWWIGGTLHLRSSVDAAGLVEFFAEAYTPTPIVAPWNGGSGYYLKDTQTGISAIEESASERFAGYREAIATCRALVARWGLRERPEGDEKYRFIEQVRAVVADEALRWIDAAIALEEDGPAYPPLLGTGGNDGRLDFSNNQMQRLAEVLLQTNGEQRLLRAALFDDPAPRLSRVAIGQFRPTSAGGANAVESFDRESLVNPWDYILVLEGALLFAVAVSRRLESAAPGAASFPFTVHVSPVGYGSAAATDETDARDEIWLPLWSRPASIDEIRALFGEGRATLGRSLRGRTTGSRAASSGVDFARAIASFGVDRGIDEFSRVGFFVRNGLSVFATPLGEWTVAGVPAAGLLGELDEWLVQLARAATGKHAPTALRRAAYRVDDAVLAVARRGQPADVGRLVAALGETEAVCARSPKARDAVRPVPTLSARWYAAAYDRSVEFRLAATLAAGGLRRYLGCARSRGSVFVWANDDGDFTWSERGLVDNLIAVLRRRESTSQPIVLDGPLTAAASDVAAFIARETDDERLAMLARGLCSLDWRGVELEASEPRDVPAIFAVCRLALTRSLPGSVELPHATGIVNRLASGDSIAATRLAERRLRGAGLVPRCGPLAAAPELARRSAAALAFHLAPSTVAAMRRQVIRTTSLEKLHGLERS